MTLQVLRDRLSVVQIAVACLAVGLGGGIPWWSGALFAAFVALAFVRRLPETPSSTATRLWTFGVFVALIATLVRAFTMGDVLDAGVDFLLLLALQRLFNRQRAREHLQLLLLGALLMIVAAVINTGLNFPFLLAIYVWVAVLTLIVNHLVAEGERLGPRVMVQVQRQAVQRQRHLARAALTVSGIALLGGAFVFAFFPRWGAGVFLRGGMARDAQSGFSGEVRLGGFGRIKSDPTVVARLVPLDGAKFPERLTWHLRGSSFDVYERGRWFHGPDVPTDEVRGLGGYQVLAPGERPLAELGPRVGPGRGGRALQPVVVPGIAASSTMVRVQVLLEDLGVDALFVASQPLGARVLARGALEQRAQIRGGRNLELKIEKPPGPIQYEFISRIGEPTSAELAAVGNPPVDDALAPYLQRSEALSTEVTGLAQQLTADASTRLDAVAAVMDHLASFQYTVELRSSPRVEAGADPLEGFLFDTRAGHCEYFASAMAVLLREVGIPTRIVNGYYGAHWNGLGEFYAVRQADAHSWVEVHFGPLGWVTFDPTPPVGRTAGDDAALLPGLAQALDAMRNAYLEYVIDYDLGKQLALLENMGMRGANGPRWRIRWRGVLVWAAGIGVLGLAIVWWRRPRRPTIAPEVQIYTRLLHRLAARGHVPGPSESPERFATRIDRAGAPEGPALRRFARLYERMRFGRPGAADLDELRRAAHAVQTRRTSR